MTTTIPYHVDLFQRLRSSLRKDLVLVGFPNPVAGQILNWFDPARPEYLDHVDQWQRLLCKGISVDPPPFVPSDELGIGYLERLEPWEVRQIHQVAKLLYKFHGEPARKTDWVAVEQRLSQARPLRLTDDEISGIRQCLSDIEPVDLNQAIGRFGPGATAEGFKAADKWERKGAIPDVPPNLYRPSPRDPWVPSGYLQDRVTKMAEVPKSIKCNRIVSSEPAMSMYAQLAACDDLVCQMHTIFKGHVSLNDQEKHNQLLRLPGMATLDLSDASDHNSCNLVRAVLPQLWPVLAKVRSEYSRTPTGRIFRLATFAPMGSGVCFPTMTLVILGIICYAFKSWGYNWRRFLFSVYGDDIIIPIWIAQYVMDLLDRAGYVINYAKSCWTGLYVESCGLELYRSYDVTPHYIRDPLEALSADTVEGLLNMGDLFPNTAKQIFDISLPIKGLRWNRDLQESEALVRTTSVRAKLSKLDGYAGLNRWFSVGTSQDVQTFIGRDGAIHHRDHSGVANEVWTKPAWRYRLASNYPNLMFMSGSHAILRRMD